MKPILVIADDLTGAAEIGGIAVERGLTAKIHRANFAAASADVTILDTDTRALAAADAAARLRPKIAAIDRNAFEFIYKKTDSVLRGPIAAELAAIIPALGFGRCRLVPQNPSRGRVIVHGEYHIDGVPLDRTPLARDPEHPAATADVRRLLGPADSVEFGEGQTLDELRSWAACLDSSTLPAGGADFFSAILESHGIAATETAPFSPPPGSVLMICGSSVPASRRFVAVAGRWVCPMPDGLYDADTAEKADEAEIAGWAGRVQEMLARQSRAIIAVPQAARADRAPHVRGLIAELTKRVLAAHRPGVILIEGGATAAAIADRSGGTEFSVAAQVGPGVVALQGPGGDLWVIKPGSYPWPAVDWIVPASISNSF